MSASSQNPIVLSGDFMEIASVTDPGGANETVEVIAGTYGETTFSKENEVVEASLHSQALTVRNIGHYTLDAEFQMVLTPGAPQLESAGLVDSNGEFISPSRHDALRFNVFTEEPDQNATPAVVFDTFNVTLDFDEINLAVGDPTEVSTTAFISGGWSVSGGQ